jgi:polyisoprenoid-binding protein YceI
MLGLGASERVPILHFMTNPSGTTATNVTVRYEIENALSRFTVQAFAIGFLSTFAHDPVISIPDFSGEAKLAEDITQSSLTLTVNPASMKVVSEVSDRDRAEVERIMREKVLEIDRYDQIIYKCSKISASSTGEGQYWTALNGELTLHGITHNLNIPARVSLNGDTLRASGNFAVLQTAYDIDLVSVAGGAIKVKDELKFSFEIVAKRGD